MDEDAMRMDAHILALGTAVHALIRAAFPNEVDKGRVCAALVDKLEEHLEEAHGDRLSREYRLAATDQLRDLFQDG